MFVSRQGIVQCCGFASVAAGLGAAGGCSRPTLAPDAPDTGPANGAVAPTAKVDAPLGLSAESSHAIPVLDEADRAAFEQDGWKTIGLGDCAALLEGHPAAGTSVPAASARVLATPGAIYVEVHDDALSITAPAIDSLGIWFCVGDGKPTSCEDWNLTMDGWLRITGPSRQLATGEWTERKLSRRAEVSAVSPTLRRFRLSPLSLADYGATFAYRKAGDGGLRTAFEERVDFPWGGAPIHCVADGGALRRIPSQ